MRAELPAGPAWRTPHVLPPSRRPKRLLIDGDGLAYAACGSSLCPPEQARANLVNMVRAAEHRVGVHAEVLLTMPGSSKGGRYFIATVKPYQAHRAGNRRPENWKFLRGVLEAGRPPFLVTKTLTAEADDLFSKASEEEGGNVAILTQDKDLRMVPGVHITWDDHMLVDTRDGEDVLAWDKQYGERWFWEQMLQGDTADNIPGLPKYLGKPVGEVTARRILDSDGSVLGPGFKVRAAYTQHYGAEAGIHLLEQAMLLWMRRDPEDPFDCVKAGGPLYGLVTQDDIKRMNARLHAET